MLKRSIHISLALTMLLVSCKQKGNAPSIKTIGELNLKRGEIISCGAPNKEFGTAVFLSSCKEDTKADFNLAIELLHSFEYDDAEKAFAKVIDKDPSCAMAYWGIAMSNFHALWTPPSEAELKKGLKAAQVAQSLDKTKREGEYIDAISAFYTDWDKKDHLTRCLLFEKGMEKVYTDYPEDKEAAIFYSLALNAAADPKDKTFGKQKKAGDILIPIYKSQPNHPGIVHYIIHTYDYPELASLGLEAARRYASVAPSSAHALHMPSHIFTRLGLWNECIQSNIASVESAKCYAQSVGIKGHWDEELHGLDYQVYGYLQKGEKDSAKQLLDYLGTIKSVTPTNFKVAYAFAAIPSRYYLESKMWDQAAKVSLAENIPWKNFPWQEAIVHFTRLLGAVHTKQMPLAKTELNELNRLQNILVEQKDAYKANQVAIQVKAGEAWIALAQGKKDDAIKMMRMAADMEDKTEKHPVTPCEVLPADELLGDMYTQLDQPKEALQAYEENLRQRPNRFHSLFGAAVAARQFGDYDKSKLYHDQLIKVVGEGNASLTDIVKINSSAFK